MSLATRFSVAVRDPLLRFLSTAAGLYVLWYLAYELVIHPWGKLDRAVIDNLIDLSGWMLKVLGHSLIPEPANAEMIRTIGVQGGHLLWIGDPCNGVSLFAVFLIFIVAYPGPWRHKLWFGPLGLLSIHLINALRIVALCLVVTIDYELLNFNHDYTFYVIVYGWVFILWALWVRTFRPDSHVAMDRA
ncbi:MAG: archaeosortase/exosortase family protein [Flavobacteriales bacterium]|nr:archaeosortase/exosortase family protein [Flavobacteriales bacterium]